MKELAHKCFCQYFIVLVKISTRPHGTWGWIILSVYANCNMICLCSLCFFLFLLSLQMSINMFTISEQWKNSFDKWKLHLFNPVLSDGVRTNCMLFWNGHLRQRIANGHTRNQSWYIMMDCDRAIRVQSVLIDWRSPVFFLWASGVYSVSINKFFHWFVRRK